MHRAKQPSRRTKSRSRARPSTDFWRHRSADELADEQGIGPITDLGDVISKGASLWANDKELERFLADIRERRRKDRAD